MMNAPRMILFDYGQTLLCEQGFDGVAGTKAVLRYATKNNYNHMAEEIQAAANEINREVGRGNPKTRHQFQIEVPNHMLTAYLYQSMGIELSLTSSQIDRVFWDAASPAVPTEGIEEFLLYLKARQIRTGVISNISYCAEVVQERICRMLPCNDFEFILTSSEYMFRKPHARIFQLALEKAGLQPEEVWYIGDDYQCDVVGARNAGIFPVYYIGASKKEPMEDVLTVSTWEELEAYIENQ